MNPIGATFQTAIFSYVGLCNTADEAATFLAANPVYDPTDPVRELETLLQTRPPAETWQAIAARFRDKLTTIGSNATPSSEEMLRTERAVALRAWGVPNPIEAARLEEALRLKIPLSPEAPEVAQRFFIIARTNELLLADVPNATDVARLEQQWGFKLDLDPSKIEARAKELRSLFSFVTLPVPAAFDLLPLRQKEAIIKVARAMRLLNVPYRLQSNAYGAIFEKLVMNTPALAPLREYYVRFGGVYNFLKPDENRKPHSFLPGMEQIARYPGGGFYPYGMTEEQFREHIPAGSSLDREMRVLFRFNETGELVAIPFSKAYAEWLQPAAELLEEAAALIEQENPKMAVYLRSSARAFRTNDFRDNDLTWLQLTDGPLDANVGAVEQYMDALRGYMAQFTGTIQVKDPELEKKLFALKEAYPELEENLPVPAKYKKPRAQRIPPPVSVVNVIYGSGDDVSGEGIAVAYNRPNDEGVRSKGIRIVLMQNLYDARTKDAVGKKLTELAIDPSQQSLATSEGGILSIFFHEEAHGNAIEYVLGTNNPATQALGEIGRSFEELRADVVGLHNAKTAFDLGLISGQTLHEIYVSQIRREIGILRKGIAGAHARGALVILNYLQNAGAIAIDPETGMTKVDLEKMPSVIAEFSALLITIKGDGNKKVAEALYERWGQTPPVGLQFIYDAMQDLPVDSLIRFAFDDKI